ncbi:transposase [Acetobacter sicerae]|uniref:Mutator family transposase n=2 Tax=Acetobacteraceae TaxID=433 RepID=A0ABS8VW36_9PROT|nr:MULTISPECIES: transposase [Acetobacter]MCE0743874.1 transposase [Acetobacter sicerae]
MAGRPNCRNGYGQKTVSTDAGRVLLDIRTIAQGRCEPQLIARYWRRCPAFDERIVSLYASGPGEREIHGHLLEIYGMEASPDLIIVPFWTRCWRNTTNLRAWHRPTISTLTARQTWASPCWNFGP